MHSKHRNKHKFILVSSRGTSCKVNEMISYCVETDRNKMDKISKYPFSKEWVTHAEINVERISMLKIIENNAMVVVNKHE